MKIIYSGIAASGFLALSCMSSYALADSQNTASPIQPRHGTAETPPSRQYYCYLQQDYYNPADGSGIKNEACKQAFQAGDFENWQRPKMFNDWNAYSQNLQGTTHPSDKVPDGQLCSAGKTEFDGINLPSAHWSTTNMIVRNGRINVSYYASQMHDPSEFKVYLTKTSFDPASQRLKWADLSEAPEVLVTSAPDAGKQQKNNVPGYYYLDVKLPEGYTTNKNAVLYIQWQRHEDPARETFFSCSDVNLQNMKAAPDAKQKS